MIVSVNIFREHLNYYARATGVGGETWQAM